MTTDNSDDILGRIRITDTELLTILRSLEFRIKNINRILATNEPPVGEQNVTELTTSLKKVVVIHHKLLSLKNASATKPT